MTILIIALIFTALGAGFGILPGLLIKAEDAPSSPPVSVLPAEQIRMTALVRCSGGGKPKFVYQGVRDCRAALLVADGANQCRCGCIGLGSCAAACPKDAITAAGVAVVDPEICDGCGLCLTVCPRGLIETVPYYADVHVTCASPDENTAKVCDSGCIACRQCETVCQIGAIRVEDHLAHIDVDRCLGCGDCADACPRKVIIDQKLDHGSRHQQQDS